MTRLIAPPAANAELLEGTRLIVDSFARLLQRPLIDAAVIDVFAALWHAPRVVVAHGGGADPVFFYGNRTALELFEIDFDGFTQMPSRFSAEQPHREARARLLEAVSRQGYIDHYSGIRVSHTGRRFRIQNGIVWNLADRGGTIHGQAATFDRWESL